MASHIFDHNIHMIGAYIKNLVKEKGSSRLKVD